MNSPSTVEVTTKSQQGFKIGKTTITRLLGLENPVVPSIICEEIIDPSTGMHEGRDWDLKAPDFANYRVKVDSRIMPVFKAGSILFTELNYRYIPLVRAQAGKNRQTREVFIAIGSFEKNEEGLHKLVNTWNNFIQNPENMVENAKVFGLSSNNNMEQ